MADVSASTAHGLAICRVPLDSLHLDPSNARVHNEENMAAIEGSLRSFARRNPPSSRRPPAASSAAMAASFAMRELGWKECDIVELDIDDLQATALGIALNRSASLGVWNDETLSKPLLELRNEDALDCVGYSGEDIEKLLARSTAERTPQRTGSGASRTPATDENMGMQGLVESFAPGGTSPQAGVPVSVQQSSDGLPVQPRTPIWTLRVQAEIAPGRVSIERVREDGIPV